VGLGVGRGVAADVAVGLGDAPGAASGGGFGAVGGPLDGSIDGSLEGWAVGVGDATSPCVAAGPGSPGSKVAPRTPSAGPSCPGRTITARTSAEPSSSTMAVSRRSRVRGSGGSSEGRRGSAVRVVPDTTRRRGLTTLGPVPGVGAASSRAGGRTRARRPAISVQPGRGGRACDPLQRRASRNSQAPTRTAAASTRMSRSSMVTTVRIVPETRGSASDRSGPWLRPARVGRRRGRLARLGRPRRLRLLVGLGRELLGDQGASGQEEQEEPEDDEQAQERVDLAGPRE
jgi:hypothetical protein